ncbi:GRAS family protein RAM1-like [Lycium ferocissimum]|uniref:GRAS family protein RAM1-like n=1 Tax=Lycium ferocissimum TaxID=112874 RepID=UPI002814A6A5|nr:GRAS family protein RAM1-like [Lycium ferocissimum]
MDSFHNEATKKTNDHPTLASLELLKRFKTKTKCLTGEKQNQKHSASPWSSNSSRLPSTDEIMNIARARLHQFTSINSSVYSIILDPSILHSGLSPEVAEDVELSLLLQASAEMFVQKQYDRARKFLSLCDHSASVIGNPVQRVVYYFAEALRNRIDKETGVTPERGNRNRKKAVDVERPFMLMKFAFLACRQETPLSHILQFAGIQAVLDNIVSVRRVHIIDFGRETGLPMPIIMHALANRNDCPIERLKITSVGTSRQRIEENGKRLSSFAETLNIPFLFNMVVLELKDLKKENFDLEEGEVVAVYSEFRLCTMLA